MKVFAVRPTRGRLTDCSRRERVFALFPGKAKRGKKAPWSPSLPKPPVSLALFAASSALAAELPAGLEGCAGIEADRERLLCYDRLAGRHGEPVAAGIHPVERDARWPSPLSRLWELEDADKQGIFNFRPHRDNYLVATYNTSPNQDPFRPVFSQGNQPGSISRTELAFQLGFKLKLLENMAGSPADLWFGYTQRSFWQATNRRASSLFRTTDYEPEVMAVLPTDVNLLGLRLRFLGAGLVHQSNGRASTLSRSWNRAYLQAGFERDDFTLAARVWKRFDESASEDNNPRIVDYMGRGDLYATYNWNGHRLSLLARHNFQTDKGAAQLDWAFPLAANLKGYVQLFSGYGYTLIDYDAYQRVIGLGVLVSY